MYALKHKSNSQILLGILIFIMLILSAVAYGRGGKREGSGGRLVSSDRSQMLAPATRGRNMGGEQMNSTQSRSFAEPQQRFEASNEGGRNVRLNIDRQSNVLAMRFDRPQLRLESNNNSSMRADQKFWSNDDKKQRENINNRVWARTEPMIGQKFNRDVMMSDVGDKERGNIGALWRETPPRTHDSKLPSNSQDKGTDKANRNKTISKEVLAVLDSHNTQPQFLSRACDNSRFTWKGRDNHNWQMSSWSCDRDNTTLKVVNNVPDAVKTQRSSWWTRTKDLFNCGGYNNRTIFRSRNDFVYYGRHHYHRFAYHRIVRPDFFFVTYFNCGPWYTYRPVYPYYHRRYIFVNPCGYWPYGYTYLRYYWYSCYPYFWYGYNPIPYEYGGDIYYYTYNYYGNSAGPVTGNVPACSAQQPAPETTADQYFDDGVKAFEAKDYNTAIAKFALARQLAPDDKVLAFAYSQAYFAIGDYKSAAQVLRAAVAKVNPVDEGIFYPRGLYSNDDILLKQVDDLSAKASQTPQDTDMQLLLGYHYLGLGELDKAAAPLKNASADSLNGPPASALLQLLDKLQTAKAEVQT